MTANGDIESIDLIYDDAPGVIDRATLSNNFTIPVFQPDDNPAYEDLPGYSSDPDNERATATDADYAYEASISTNPEGVYGDAHTDDVYEEAEKIATPLVTHPAVLQSTATSLPTPAQRAGMIRTNEEAIRNEESFYAPIDLEGKPLATVSQLPPRVPGGNNSLSHKAYGEVVFTDITRAEVEAKLSKIAEGKDGVYLLRTTPKLIDGVVMSFFHGGSTRHFQFRRERDQFINKAGLPVGHSVVELIRYYRKNWADGLPSPPRILYLPAPLKR